MAAEEDLARMVVGYYSCLFRRELEDRVGPYSFLRYVRSLCGRKPDLGPKPGPSLIPMRTKIEKFGRTSDPNWVAGR